VESIKKQETMTTHFDLNEVKSITIYPETPTQYKFYPPKYTEPKKLFGLITLISAKWHQGGWCEDTRYPDYYPYYTSVDLEGYGYKVNLDDLKVYNKCHISISIGYKQSVGKKFESIEEAEKYVSKLIKKTGKSFAVIRK